MLNHEPDCPQNFGYKTCWLAVYSNSAEDVLASLPLSNLARANWRTGLAAAYQQRVFVTPSIDEWVLIVSPALPQLGEVSDQKSWNSMMQILSHAHEEVQYFGSHRVVGYCAWARYIDGEENRAFAYLGESIETLINREPRTPGEIELGYEYFDERSSDAITDLYWERDDLCFPDEEHVLEIAGHWSVNPSMIEELKLPPSVGWVGDWDRTA